jgi:hypothetical protein
MQNDTGRDRQSAPCHHALVSRRACPPAGLAEPLPARGGFPAWGRSASSVVGQEDLDAGVSDCSLHLGRLLADSEGDARRTGRGS